MRLLTACTLAIAGTFFASVDLAFGQPANDDYGNYLATVANLQDLTKSPFKVQFFGFGEMDDETRKSIREDCGILNHLISESMSLTDHRRSMGVSVAQSFGKNGAMYVDGTGLIFTYHVGFPVAPVSKQPDDESASDTAKEKTDWEKAREALNNRNSSLALAAAEYRLKVGVRVTPEYDKDQVDTVIEAITNTLKQAENCRGLDSDDSITVYVYGPGEQKDGKDFRTVLACRVKLNSTSNVEQIQYGEPNPKGAQTIYQRAGSGGGVGIGR